MVNTCVAPGCEAGYKKKKKKMETGGIEKHTTSGNVGITTSLFKISE